MPCGILPSTDHRCWDIFSSAPETIPIRASTTCCYFAPWILLCRLRHEHCRKCQKSVVLSHRTWFCMSFRGMGAVVHFCTEMVALFENLCGKVELVETILTVVLPLGCLISIFVLFRDEQTWAFGMAYYSHKTCCMTDLESSISVIWSVFSEPLGCRIPKFSNAPLRKQNLEAEEGKKHQVCTGNVEYSHCW